VSLVTFNSSATITKGSVADIRIEFPRLGPGSDAHNQHTTYSNPYVVVRDSDGAAGAGIGFTLGKGNEQVCAAIDDLLPLVVGEKVSDLLGDFRTFWRRLANPEQRRWLGPYSGSYYMAAGAIANALFDLFAKKEQLPLWKLLLSLSPEQIVALIDFRYVEHLLTEQEALEMLRTHAAQSGQRASAVWAAGLDCYFTTWIGTDPDALVAQIADVMGSKGIRRFKVKVGSDLDRDRAKLTAIRQAFGNDVELYVDANQVWSAPQAVEWMKELAQFGIGWIEEPTAPDSVDGHKYVREGLAPLGIDVVTGENCPNSHVAAHFISSNAVDRFQIDACRVLGPAENVLIMLLAKKFGVPICPHAGGSGLDELVPHLSAWNAIALDAGSPKAITEHVALCSHCFESPSRVVDGKLQLPELPGYLVGMRPEAIGNHRFPDGEFWRGLS
jgi:L-fuconate dehydratase